MNKIWMSGLIFPSLILFGLGCSESGSTTKNEINKIEPLTKKEDSFEKKLECNKLEESAKRKIRSDFAPDEIAFEKICYSTKYNTCVYEFIRYVKDSKVVDEVTFFQDILTGETLNSVTLLKNQESGAGDYLDRSIEAKNGIGCVE